MPTSHVSRPDDWPEIAARLGRRVRDRREALGLTQEDLAERTGLSRNQVQNIERPQNSAARTSNPKLDAIWALAAALEVDISALVSDTSHN